MASTFQYHVSLMEIVNRLARMSDIARKLLTADVKIGLVPTMGAIHPGHMSLIQAARKMTDVVVASIFVNRLQFPTDEEYRQYPRDITKDVDILRDANIDYVFTPSEEEMYPPGFATYVEVKCFEDRIPGSRGNPFFTGMTTSAMKLLQIVRPSFIFIGQKDAVHGAVLRKMMIDLNINTEVVIKPVVRDESGLAYAARNSFLDDEQRKAAGAIYRGLKSAEQAIAAGEYQSRKIIKIMAGAIGSEPLAKLEYVMVVDPVTLEALPRVEGTALLAVGATIGNTLLSDSILIESPVHSTAGNEPI